MEELKDEIIEKIHKKIGGYTTFEVVQLYLLIIEDLDIEIKCYENDDD